VGEIYVNPLAGQEADASFLDAVNRSLLIATGAAGLLALLLTLAVSRGILGPIESLTAAARRMERGDLASRVAVSSSKNEIGELAHAFNAMAEALSRNELLRRHMVSDVAHELRTPLTNIRGYLEGIRDGVFAADRETIDSIYQEAELLGRVVDDLQELALAEAGQLRLEKRNVRLVEAIEAAISGVRPQYAAHDLKLETDAPAGLPEIEVDAERLGQVLRNLLNNALAHTPRGGKVTITARENGGDIEVTVADSGVGISPEDLPNIFERFYRADKSRARTTGGAGLGLTIARQIIGAHGGDIRAESEDGRGARFIFTIPHS
jgi:signal transduction histidine kinase